MVHTKALASTASAAAIMLSLGHRRTASPKSQLLYHLSRVSLREATGPYLAEKQRDLTTLDADVVSLLAQRAAAIEDWVDRLKAPPDPGLVPSPFRDFLYHTDRADTPNAASFAPHWNTLRDAGDSDARHEFLADQYTRLFALDRPIPAELARCIGLIDDVSATEEPLRITHPSDASAHHHVSAWTSLFPAGVPRHDLTRRSSPRPHPTLPDARRNRFWQDPFRHFLMLGETGSGKTRSGILPVLHALLSAPTPPPHAHTDTPEDRLACALIIDPKHELHHSLQPPHPDTVIRLIHPEHTALAVMDPPNPSDSYFVRARQVLQRAATFSPGTEIILGKPTTPQQDPYWPMRGSEIALTATALTLWVLQHHVRLYGSDFRQSLALEFPVSPDASSSTADSAEAPDPAVEPSPSSTANSNAASGPRIAIQNLLDKLTDLGIAAGLLAPHQSPEDTLQELREPADFGAPLRRPAVSVKGENLLALARRLLTDTMAQEADLESWTRLLGSEAWKLKGRELSRTTELRQSVNSWKVLNSRSGVGHYMSILGSATPFFYQFARLPEATTLYFGCEPAWEARRNRGDGSVGAGPELATRVFAGFDSVLRDRTKTTLIVCQPQSGSDLMARVLKARFFESVLADKERRKPGHREPLVAYVADEFHRFVTADKVHGEQSFLDQCRSFGVCCVLATQSLSSLRYALLELGSSSDKVAAAIDILFANTGNKFFFRTTETRTMNMLREWSPVTAARPPITLRPGECHAVLVDGTTRRVQLGQWEPPSTE